MILINHNKTCSSEHFKNVTKVWNTLYRICKGGRTALVEPKYQAKVLLLLLIVHESRQLPARDPRAFHHNQFLTLTVASVEGKSSQRWKNFSRIGSVCEEVLTTIELYIRDAYSNLIKENFGHAQSYGDGGTVWKGWEAGCRSIRREYFSAVIYAAGNIPFIPSWYKNKSYFPTSATCTVCMPW